jgi:hypothetical protein
MTANAIHATSPLPPPFAPPATPQPPELEVSTGAEELHLLVAGSQTAPPMQPSLDVHAVAQTPLVSHTYGAHSFVTPSALREVWSSMHVAPTMHLPLVQRPPLAQSASPVQLVLHCPLDASHVNAPHSTGVAAGQLPLPSHDAPGIERLPSHAAVRHDTDEPTNPLQLARSWPSHVAA